MNRIVPGSIWYAKIDTEECNVIVLQKNPLWVWRCVKLGDAFVYGDCAPRRIDPACLLVPVGTVAVDELDKLRSDWMNGRFPKVQ